MQAVGVVNLGSERADVSVTWAQLGVTGSQPVRDLWQQKDVGRFGAGYTVSVPAHATILVKVGKPKRVD